MGGRRGGCEGEWEGEMMQHGSPVGRVGAVTPSHEEEVTGVQTCPTQGLNERERERERETTPAPCGAAWVKEGVSEAEATRPPGGGGVTSAHPPPGRSQ
jgi:hypothetical protein